VVNAFIEDLSSLELNTSNVLLALLNLIHEIARDQEYYNNEESNQDLYLELSFLDKSGQSNTNSEGTLTIRVSILGEIITSLLISHNLNG